MFVFLHVPKTAGSTIDSVVKDQYTKRWSYRLYYLDHRYASPQNAASDLLNLPQQQQNAIEALCGHFHFGIHKCIPQPVVYYTILRKPLERVVSHYYYMLEHYILSSHLHGKPYYHPDRQRVEQGGLSLEECVTSGYLPEVDNGQTRLLAGENGLYDRTPFGQCTNALLEEAKHNLREHVQVVGLTERFDESLLLIQRLCGWKTPYYVKQNVTKSRPKLAEIPPAALAAIQERTVLDQQLYEYGVELFEQRVAEQGPDFAGQVRRFQHLNQRYGRLHLQWSHLMRQLRRGTRLAADRLSIRHSYQPAVTSLDSEM